MKRDDDDDRWRRMPVPQQGQAHDVTIRQFRDPAAADRREQLKREIATSAKSRPEELARLLQQWLHADD